MLHKNLFQLTLALAFLTFGLNGCVNDDDFDVPDIDCGNNKTDLVSNTTIAELKGMEQFKQITDDIIIEGVVVSDDTEGNFYKELVIADASGGISILLDQTGLSTIYPPGQTVVVKMQGLYLGIDGLQTYIGGVLSPDQGGGYDVEDIPSFAIKDHLFRRGCPVGDAPVTADLNNLNDGMVGKLIKLDNVQFASESLGLTYADAITQSNANRTLVDCATGREIIVRTSGFADFAGKAIPSGSGSVVGVLSKFLSTYQLYLRSESDVMLNQPRCGFANSVDGTKVTIADLRARYTAPYSSSTSVNLSDDEYIEGVVTMASPYTNSNLVFVQDDSGAGIAVYMAGNPNPMAMGNQVKINLEGRRLSTFRWLLQLGTINPAVDVELVNENGTMPAPRSTTVAELNTNDFQGTLIELQNVQFMQTGVIYDAVRNVTDCTDLTDIFIDNDAPYNDVNVQAGNGSMVGIASSYYENSQIVPRLFSEINLTGARCDIAASATAKTVADVRAMPEGDITTNIKVKGVVTSDYTQANLTERNLFMQDATAGIQLRFLEDHNLPLGQEIEVSLIGGDLDTFNGVLQVSNIPLGNIITSQAGTLPAPAVISIADLQTGNYESQLIQIDNVQFDDENDTYAGNASLTDCTDTFTTFIRDDATFNGNAVQNGNGNLIGVATKFGAANTIHLRDESDAAGLTNTRCVSIIIATDLFISEYAEGSSNNKYLELYNGTGAAVDLSKYEIWRISNGGSWPEFTTSLSGMLADGATYVICNPSADPTILAAADLQSGNSTFFNGDDAVGLAKDDGTGTFVLLDAIGTDGPDPGTGWDVGGTSNATANHTLVRKPGVVSPNTDWAASSANEWNVLAQNDWSDIGSHTF